MKTYLLSILVCALSCEVFSRFAAGAGQKKLLQLVSGTLLAVTLLRPLSRIEPELWLQPLSWDSLNPDHWIAEGENQAQKAKAECIAWECASYIFDKAQIPRGDLTLQFTLDENLIPTFVEISGYAEADTQANIQTLLATDLGISKENQQWILHPERGSS